MGARGRRYYRGLGKLVFRKADFVRLFWALLYFHYQKKQLSKLVMLQEMLYYDTNTYKSCARLCPYTELAAPWLFYDFPPHDPWRSWHQGLFLYSYLAQYLAQGKSRIPVYCINQLINQLVNEWMHGHALCLCLASLSLWHSLILLLDWLNLINISWHNSNINFTVKLFPTFSYPGRDNHLLSPRQNTQLTSSMCVYYNTSCRATEWHICVYSSGRLWDLWNMGLSINHL